MKSAKSDLSGRRVLVTGGTGFIGGRLVERLVLECNADVRVLVHSFSSASRVARLCIEMVHGDVTNPHDVERAVGGCDFVVHCAIGTQGGAEVRRRVNVEGTRNVLVAALHAGVKRVVHISTVDVYGPTPDGDLDETAPRRYSGKVYGDSKLDAEKLALRYVGAHGLPVAVIQPAVVYGPFARSWTVNILQKLRTGRVILVSGGDGLCNAVYVDDVVSAVLLAAVKEGAVGEAFLVSGEQSVTWRDFYGRYERMLGISGTVSMSAAEAEAYYIRKQREAKSILREVGDILRDEPLIRARISQTREVALAKVVWSYLPKQVQQLVKKRIGGKNRTERSQIVSEAQKPIHPLRPAEVQFFAARTRVRIDKAKRILGYQPAFDLDSGMGLTEQWARWADLLDG
jgi:nucleoside-diphosphate-sugar epimerase